MNITDAAKEILRLQDEAIVLRAELQKFKREPMSQNCRDGKHNGKDDQRCINCECLCHGQDAEVERLEEVLAVYRSEAI